MPRLIRDRYLAYDDIHGCDLSTGKNVRLDELPEETSRTRSDALAPLVEIVEVVQQVRASRDPKDDRFLEVAVNGRADVVVTGDRDLLELNPFRGIAILTPAAFIARQL